ncbi:cobalt-precorrin-6A reductase [Speluncibacter jeojiensis]|uniref:Cobalt-precorrin-6A reductase n=1 Tax=Speluncibacter jeojiensis TaxID=2710754 RepID=A0A9X4M394_9ACTN|nr:cobalt-precorrin-6A reductase [Corynebacteriales bacterium D3-21]
MITEQGTSEPRVLVLGGTAEARDLATRLHAAAVPVISSLAGRVSNPQLPIGEVRIGGFGGTERMRDWLRDNRITAVVDASHPFAARISANTAAACCAEDVPLLMLRRPEWTPAAGDHWSTVASLDEGAAALAGVGERVFLTIGRQGVGAFADCRDRWFLVRAIDPPVGPVPERMELLLARGPFDVDEEIALMRSRRIDVLVTKNSGGPLTEAKLAAARVLAIPVLMVRRPAPPAGVGEVDAAGPAADWVMGRSGGGQVRRPGVDGRSTGSSANT